MNLRLSGTTDSRQRRAVKRSRHAAPYRGSRAPRSRGKAALKRALLRLLYDLVLRHSEVVEIDPDIHLEAGTLWDAMIRRRGERGYPPATRSGGHRRSVRHGCHHQEVRIPAATARDAGALRGGRPRANSTHRSLATALWSSRRPANRGPGRSAAERDRPPRGEEQGCRTHGYARRVPERLRAPQGRASPSPAERRQGRAALPGRSGPRGWPGPLPSTSRLSASPTSCARTRRLALSNDIY